MIALPEIIKTNCRFIKILKNKKVAFEPDWENTANYVWGITGYKIIYGDSRITGLFLAGGYVYSMWMHRKYGENTAYYKNLKIPIR